MSRTKGERTREELVKQAAALFNQHGYRGASISDIMAATGLQKGGIYRHFASKEALGLAAFRFATDQMRERFTTALEGKTAARARLAAIIGVYARIPVDPPVPGGCPILNAAVEADDDNPELRRARERGARPRRRRRCRPAASCPRRGSAPAPGRRRPRRRGGA